jgi:hypothetical protein
MVFASASADRGQKSELIAGLQRGIRVGELLIDGHAHPLIELAWQLQVQPKPTGGDRGTRISGYRPLFLSPARLLAQTGEQQDPDLPRGLPSHGDNANQPCGRSLATMASAPLPPV